LLSASVLAASLDLVTLVQGEPAAFSEGRMSLRLATAVLAAAIASAPALACEGPTVLFQDNFQAANPDWYGGLSVSGGHASLSAAAGQLSFAFYGGKTIDSGDACVDVIGPPNLKNVSEARAGIMFGFTDVGNYYAFLVTEDGEASVLGVHNGASLSPVVIRPAPLLKRGANVSNSLRVTWKGSSVATFINNQPFISFTLHYIFKNSFIGLFGSNDDPAPTIFLFDTLKVTNVP